jgi:hypothetical protein
MDEYGRAGFKAVVASILLDLECDENSPQIQEQISLSLEAFAGALQHRDINDFSKAARFQGRNVRYYIKGARFPDQNHIDILSKSLTWRNQANMDLVARSYRHCYDLRKAYPKPLYIKAGYFIGPFDRWWQFDRIENIHDFCGESIQFLWWLRRLEDPKYLLVSNYISYKNTLLKWLSADDCKTYLPAEYVKQYKKYLSIERSWRSETAVQCDLIFPAVMGLCKREQLF